MAGQRQHRWYVAAALAAPVLALLGCGSTSTLFSANQRVDVTVENLGPGSGAVVSPDPDVHIDCQFTGPGGICGDGFFDAGLGGVITLDATPAAGSVLTGWSGCTSVTGARCLLVFDPGPDTTFSPKVRFDPAGAFGVNQLVDPGFEQPVTVGGLPSATGLWRGDSAYSVGADQGLTAHAGGQMLRFMRSGLVAGAGVVSSQQWQLVDISALATDIDAGKVRVDGSAWFNRVVGTATTDTRFDVRVLGYTGTPAGFPGSYNSPASVAAGTVLSTGGSWQQVSVADTLPAGTRYLALEIYAYEDVQDDAADPEFDGHYADDASLVLTLLP